MVSVRGPVEAATTRNADDSHRAVFSACDWLFVQPPSISAPFDHRIRLTRTRFTVQIGVDGPVGTRDAAATAFTGRKVDLFQPAAAGIVSVR